MGRKKKSDVEVRERSRSRERKEENDNQDQSQLRNEEEGPLSQEDNADDNEQLDQNQNEDDQGEENQYQEEQEKNPAEELASEIRSIFIDFFGSIHHEKGLVFTVQDRSKMIKEQNRLRKKNSNHKKIEWLPESDWNQPEEKAKISRLFDRKKQEFSTGLPQMFASQAQENLIRDVFLRSSYIFCNEVTEELYRLEMEVLLIILLTPESQRIRLAELMKTVCSETSPYLFFGFRFSGYHKLLYGNETTSAYLKLGEELAKYLKLGLDKAE